MEIKILTANKKLYEGEVKRVTFPGRKGEFQVLENHAPLFSLLTQGEIIVKNDAKETRVSISSGIVKVLNNRIICLVDKF
ncbi:ATP synthase F1 subunit epsilon [bacterium]|nr:ATP synthase F1 subunit epsilon [bacterium]